MKAGRRNEHCIFCGKKFNDPRRKDQSKEHFFGKKLASLLPPKSTKPTKHKLTRNIKGEGQNSENFGFLSKGGHLKNQTIQYTVCGTCNSTWLCTAQEHFTEAFKNSLNDANDFPITQIQAKSIVVWCASRVIMHNFHYDRAFPQNPVALEMGMASFSSIEAFALKKSLTAPENWNFEIYYTAKGFPWNPTPLDDVGFNVVNFGMATPPKIINCTLALLHVGNIVVVAKKNLKSIHALDFGNHLTPETKKLTKSSLTHSEIEEMYISETEHVLSSIEQKAVKFDRNFSAKNSYSTNIDFFLGATSSPLEK